MSKLIDAETVVHWESYDDESETVLDHTGTIADFLDIMTYEGCPESVDAVPVVRGKWIPCHPLGEHAPEGYICSVCRVGGWEKTNFCPCCGARNIEGDGERKDGDGND